MTSDARQAVGESLQGMLADLYATFVMAQNLHWNLIGKEFFELHLLLEKQYEGLHEVIDEVAERIRALGMYVDASFAQFQKQMTIKECKQVMTVEDGLGHLLHALETTIKRARATCNLAEDKHDHGSVDLLGRLLGLLEKFAWMIRSSK